MDNEDIAIESFIDFLDQCYIADEGAIINGIKRGVSRIKHWKELRKTEFGMKKEYEAPRDVVSAFTKSESEVLKGINIVKSDPGKLSEVRDNITSSREYKFLMEYSDDDIDKGETQKIDGNRINHLMDRVVEDFTMPSNDAVKKIAKIGMNIFDRFASIANTYGRHYSREDRYNDMVKEREKREAANRAQKIDVHIKEY